MSLKVGDNVIVIAGKDRGKKGTIRKKVQGKTGEKNDEKVLIDGVNRVKKHVKPSENQEGGIIEIEKPIHHSNVMLVCPHTGKPTRIGYTGSGKEKQRISKVSGKVIEESKKKS